MLCVFQVFRSPPMAQFAQHGAGHSIKINPGERPPPLLREIPFDFEKLTVCPAFKRFGFRGSAENETLLVAELDGFAAGHCDPAVDLTEVELSAQLAME